MHGLSVARLAALSLVVLLAGCAATFKPTAFKRLPDGLGENGAIAFNIEDSRMRWATVVFDDNGALFNNVDGNVRDGFAFIPMPPGQYRLNRLTHTVQQGNVLHVSTLTMDVPVTVAAGKVAYLGTLYAAKVPDPGAPAKGAAAGTGAQRLLFVQTPDTLRRHIARENPLLAAALQPDDIVNAAPAYVEGDALQTLRRYIAGQACLDRGLSPRCAPDELVGGDAGTLARVDVAKPEIRLIDAGTRERLYVFNDLDRAPSPTGFDYAWSQFGDLYRVGADRAERVDGRVPWTNALAIATWRDLVLLSSRTGHFAVSTDNGATWRETATRLADDDPVDNTFFDAGNAVLFGPLTGEPGIRLAELEGYVIGADGSARRIAWPDYHVRRHTRFHQARGHYLMPVTTAFGSDSLQVLDAAGERWEKRKLPSGKCRLVDVTDEALTARCKDGVQYTSADLGKTWR